MTPFLLILSTLSFAAAWEGKVHEVPPGRAVVVEAPCPRLDLLAAVREGHGLPCLKKAAKNMDANEQDREGNTSLHVAILARNAPAIHFLLGHGADLSVRNHVTQTPRELAEALGHRVLADYLSDRELETERLFAAVEENNLAAARSSLKRGASLGTRTTRMDSALHRASQSGFAQMAALLLQSGASPRVRNYLGETPLHSAALRDFSEVMDILLKAGADPNAVNHRRETALDLSRGRAEGRTQKLRAKAKAVPGTRADVEVDVSGSDGAPFQYDR